MNSTDVICFRQTILIRWKLLVQNFLMITFLAIFLPSSLTANTTSSFIVHCSLIINWLPLTIIFTILKIFSIVSSINIWRSISFYFTFGLKNSFLSLSLFPSTYFSLSFVFTPSNVHHFTNTAVYMINPRLFFYIYLQHLLMHKSCLWPLAMLLLKLFNNLQ